MKIIGRNGIIFLCTMVLAVACQPAEGTAVVTSTSATAVVVTEPSPTPLPPTVTPSVTSTSSPTPPPPTATVIPATPTLTATETPPPSPTPTEIISADTVLYPENLSAGDLYAPELGNLGYDVQQYTLRLALDPSVRFVDGVATIQAFTTLSNLTQISLDLNGFDITSITVDDAPTTFFRQNRKLIVNLPKPLASDFPFELEIAYSGEPITEPSAYVPFAPHLGLHYVDDSLFVVSEPDGAQNWFPANDHPHDKAMFRFELIVPAGLTGITNGIFLESIPGIPLPDGSEGELFIWEHRDPMATYLATVVVGEYERIEALSPNGVLLRHYTFPENRAEFELAMEPVGEMVDWLAELFGPYPFEAVGYVTTPQDGFSLETQTMVVLSTRMMREDVVIHELVHMWFGNWVSPASWADIWRNEGFATYVADLWLNRDNPEALEQRILRYEQIISAEPEDYPLNNPPPAQLFGRDSYIKGAVAAHTLRQEIGDDAFFAGLRLYFERHGGGTATHAEFQAALEETSGQSLDSFFAAWFQ